MRRPPRYLLEHSVCPIFALVRCSRQKDGAAEQVRHGDLRCRGVYCMMAGGPWGEPEKWREKLWWFP